MSMETSAMPTLHLSGDPEVVTPAGKRFGRFYRKFRVHFGHWYFGCRVFDTLTEMHNYARRLEDVTNQRIAEKDTNAVFVSFALAGSDPSREFPCHGTFLFTRKTFKDPGLIAHECLHAVVYLKKNFPWRDAKFASDGTPVDAEEFMACAISHLVKQMHRQL